MMIKPRVALRHLPTLPVRREDAALVVALALGALLSPPLLVVALAFAACFAVRASVPGTPLWAVVTRILAYAVISLAAGLVVASGLGCGIGLITTAVVYTVANLGG